MVMYVLDALRYREGAFFAAWLSVGFANMAMLMSSLFAPDRPLLMSLCVCFVSGFALFLTGA